MIRSYGLNDHLSGLGFSHFPSGGRVPNSSLAFKQFSFIHIRQGLHTYYPSDFRFVRFSNMLLFLPGFPFGLVGCPRLLCIRQTAAMRQSFHTLHGAPIHPFVYLVPIVMLLGIGSVPGTVATIIFALPPIVRLTNLGIRQVPKEVVEAGRAFGANNRQLLWDVQMPLAMPTIMAGLNQTLMLSLSMVVIIALIAGGGLGQEILRSVGRLDIGRAVTSGVTVLILAIVLDRISQASGVSKKDKAV